MKRIKTVEYEPGVGWIARHPYTGKEILEEGFRWNCRASARCVVWEARILGKPSAPKATPQEPAQPKE